MKFGIAVPHSGPLASVDNISRIAVLAETLGFDSLLAHDHINYDTEWLGHRVSGLVEPNAAIEPDFYESLTTLAFVAGFTRQLRLSTNVLVLPLRDPRVLARQVITLQALSRGRFVLGAGIGDYPGDYRVMQIPYADKSAMTDEFLAALSAILPGGRASFHGERIDFESGSFFPRVEPIPILLGGGIRRRANGDYELYEPVLKRIARWGHGWIPEGPAEHVATGIKRIAELADEHGRGDVEFEVRMNSPLYIDEDKVARDKTRRTAAHEMIGSVPSLIRLTERFESAGADAINLRCFAEDPDTLAAMLETFAAEVMPRFA